MRILPKDPRDEIVGPGKLLNISEVVEMMIDIRTALEDQLEFMKREKEDSKNL